VGIIDFILNLAGLLLWLNWRAARLDPLSQATPATLVGTLRRAEPARMKRWHFLVALAGLIAIRAVFYWKLGSALNWTAGLNLVATKLAFQSDFFLRMLLFSVLSFALTLGIFFLWLLLLSLLAPMVLENYSLTRLVRLHLGRVDNWPRPAKLLLPWLAGAVLWWSLSWILSSSGLLPRSISPACRFGQAALVGFSAYLGWKYLIAGLLLLHLVNDYIYFGKNPLWSYVDVTARQLLAPLRNLPLRVGKMDFAPLVGIAIVFLAARLAEIGLVEMFQRWSR
jgi:uncharacterized protein YggT (Ycf19 family)